jgi:glutamyl-tRNA reductase
LSEELRAVVLAAGQVSATERAAFARKLDHAPIQGALLVETCHRVEFFAPSRTLAARDFPLLPDGAVRLSGVDAGRHLIRLAVGLESVVVGEDQILHQLRGAAAGARLRGALPAELDRLIDLALAAGRRARTWLPARRRSLVDLILERASHGPLSQQQVLVVGAGKMGSLGVATLQRQAATVLVTSRSAERASSLAQRANIRSVAFDPGPVLASRLDGVLIAISGDWRISDATLLALASNDAWIADLSSPPALEPAAALRLAGRLVTVDEVAGDRPSELAEPLVRRLEELVDGTVHEYLGWLERRTQRDLAHQLGAKALAARSDELAELWRRMPDLDPATRAEVERMATHLTDRLMRDPLERLAQDSDGRHAAAAREFFRL